MPITVRGLWILPDVESFHELELCRVEKQMLNDCHVEERLNLLLHIDLWEELGSDDIHGWTQRVDSVEFNISRVCPPLELFWDKIKYLKWGNLPLEV